jgi:hypothetical protein
MEVARFLLDLQVEVSTRIIWMKKNEITLGMKHLVDAINATDRMSTIRSCNGYWSIFGTCQAYVRFRGDIASAEQLAAEIFHYGPVMEDLHYDWQLTGLFDPELGLYFRLAIQNILPNRRKLSEDIRFLCEVVRRLGSENPAK